MTAPDSTPWQLPRARRSSQPWANGQGVSESVSRHVPDEPRDEILWRVNIADIPGDCDFSQLVGVDRQFMLLDDVELTLELDLPRLVQPLEPIEFAGEMAPVCRAAAPARAINLLMQRDRVFGRLELVTVTRSVHIPVPPGGSVVVVKLDGDPTWRGGRDLRPGDAVRLDRPVLGGPIALPLSGHGRVAAISVLPIYPRHRDDE
ncbi:HutD family protein [Nakamurella panacisegetis]|uniref:HutD family protein n=1 Tax=Nakamurella panacisegetis TaxID=1090615 RepID=UPI0012FDAF5D|nr:HutD family protein [Nakamurella panacisegetis]